MALSDDLLEKWKQQRSIVFLLQYKDHYVVVIIEIGGDLWWETVTGYDIYESLKVDIWKESVHFIAKKFGVTNRTTLVIKTCAGTKNPQLPLQMVFIQIRDA